MKNYKQIFSENLTRLRGEKTQAAMAHELDPELEASNYNRWENGTIPQEAMVRRICEYFDVTESQLFLDKNLLRTTSDDIIEIIANLPKIADNPGLVAALKTILFDMIEGGKTPNSSSDQEPARRSKQSQR